MKLVSRKVLESLLRKSISESDGSAKKFSFTEFAREYQRLLNIYAKDRSQNRKTIFTSIYDDIKNNYLKDYCPPIEYCGEGSSRAAYACCGGKCLKVAMNERGIAQNKQEIENLQNDGNDNLKYLCFTKLYEWDEHGYGLMTECCSQADDRDFDQIYGSPNGLNAIFEVFKALYDAEFDFKEATMDLKREVEIVKKTYVDSPRYLQQVDIAQWKVDCLENIEKSQAVQWRILRELIVFYKTVGVEKLDVEDLGNIENWGMAIREKNIVPVIIDAGLSQSVYDEYYQ